MKTEKIEQLELQCLEYAAVSFPHLIILVWGLLTFESQKLEEFQQQFAGTQATNENLRKSLVSTKVRKNNEHYTLSLTTHSLCVFSSPAGSEGVASTTSRLHNAQKG